MPDNIPNVKLIPVDRILPSPHQARKYFSEESIKSLADSIEKEGLLEPIMARVVPAPNPLPEGAFADGEWYELILGERRWRAHKYKGWKLIEAKIVVADNPAAAASKSLVENLQREGINPIEEAQGFDHLNQLDPGYWTHEEIGKTVGKDRVYITQSIGILGLPQSVKDYVIRITLTRSHAIQLMRLPSPGLQEKAAKEIVAKDLNRENTSQLIAKMLSTNEQTTDTAPAQLSAKTVGFTLGKSTKTLHLAGDFPADIGRADFMKAASEAYQQWQANKKASSKKSVRVAAKLALPVDSKEIQPKAAKPPSSEDKQASQLQVNTEPQPSVNITAIEGSAKLFAQCEAELERLAKEYAEAKTEEEKSAKKAELQKSRANYNELRKFFDTPPLEFPEIQ